MEASESLRANSLAVLRQGAKMWADDTYDVSDGFWVEVANLRQQVRASRIHEFGDVQLYSIRGEIQIPITSGIAEKLDPLIDGLNRKASLSSATRTDDGSLRWHLSLLFHQSSEPWAYRTFAAGLRYQMTEALRTRDLLTSRHPNRSSTEPSSSDLSTERAEELANAIAMLKEMFQRQHWVTSVGDLSLTTEIDFGAGTSLYQIMSQTHPDYGPGVFFLLNCPLGLRSGSLLRELLEDAAAHLNESMRSDTLSEDSVFGVGAWVPSPKIESVSLNAFLPEAVAEASSIVNLAVSIATRAKQLGEKYGDHIFGPGLSKSVVERISEMS